MKKNETRADVASPDAAQLQQIERNLESFLSTADVRRVFGDPVQSGDTILVPAAEVLTAMGFGLGWGTGTQDGGEGEGTGSGGGGGGGGKSFSRPVAVVVADPSGVRVEPVFDFTKIALAALTASGFALAAWWRMRKASELDDGC